MKKNYIALLFLVIGLVFSSLNSKQPILNSSSTSQPATSSTCIVGQVIDCFAGKNHDFKIEPVNAFLKLIEICSPEGNFRFFGIKKEDQVKLNLCDFKRLLIASLGSSTSRIIQIIGDSRKLGEEGSAFGRKFLQEHCFSQNCLIEYGYTGYMCENEMEVNSFVNELLNRMPNQSCRVLANVVSESHIAVEKWGCKVSQHVKNFIVVYNDAGTLEEKCTKFGDDVFISDNLLNVADGDSIICLDGGFQSFRQVVNCLKLGLRIELVYNLRKPGGEKLFSTATFLNKVRIALGSNPRLAPQDIKNVFEEYSKTLNKIWAENSPEQAAMDYFIFSGLYSQIPVKCSFFDAKI